MKKIMKIFVLVAAAAMALASCQKNEFDNSTSQEYEYTFHIGNADTKATLGDVSVEWASGDKMGLYAVTTSGDVSYNTMGYITPGQPATMKVYSYNALAAGDMIYAYYPYTQGNAQIPTEVSISLPANQDGNDDMPMVSLPMVVTSDIAEKENVAVEAGEIKLVNLAAIAEFNVYSSNVEYQSEKVKSVSFTANKAIAGNFTFDLTSVDYSNAATLAISGYTDTEVVSTLSTAAAVGTAKESATKVKMVVAPGEGYTGTVVVATDKASYTFNVTKAKTFTRSSVLPLAVDLANGERVENAAEPEGTVSATISFANTDQRTSYSSSEQVWENDGVVFKNSKGSSTSNVGNYSNPARFYKSSDITITAPGNITSLRFDCTLGSYLESKHVTPLSEIEGAVQEGDFVVVTLDGTSNSFTHSGLSAQARANSVTVTYIQGESGGEDGGETPVEPVQLTMSEITCSTQTANSLTFTWAAVANALKYEVTFNYGAAEEVTATSYTATGLTASTSYTISVKAVGDGTNYTTSEAKTQTGTTTAAQGGGNEGEGRYTLVTTLTDITTGQYVIATKVDDTYYAMSNTFSKKISGNVVNVADNVISETDATNYVVTITKTNDNYAIQLSDGKYLSYGTSGTDFSNSSSSYNWNVAVGTYGSFRIKATTGSNRAIMWQDSGSRFGAYSTTNSSGYHDVELFKKN